MYTSTEFIIADVVVLAAVLLAVIIGAKRGLIKSVAGIVVVILAIVGASFVSGYLTDPVTEWLQPRLEEKLQEKITAAVEKNAEKDPSQNSDARQLLNLLGQSGENGEKTLNSMEKGGTLHKLLEGEAFKRLLHFTGGSDGSADSFLGELAERAKETGRNMMSELVHTMLRSVVRAVLFVLAYVILRILLSLIVRSLDLVAKLPVIHQANALGGGIIGLLYGLLLAFLAVWILRRCHVLITEDMIEGTYLLRFFANHSPMELIELL